MRIHSIGILAMLPIIGAGCSGQGTGTSEVSPAAKVAAAAGKIIAAQFSRKPEAKAALPSRRVPQPLDSATIGALTHHGRYESTRHLSEGASSAVKAHTARSVPHWAGSYSLGGTTYPYTMVGDEPREGGTTSIKTTILPVSLSFDEYADANGNPLQVDMTPIVPLVQGSPEFVASPFATGNTQFTDGMMRAEFWHTMGRGYHTVLGAPRMQKGITMEIPVGAAQVFSAPDGAVITLIDGNFFNSQLNTMIQMADLHWDEFAILLTPNLFITDGNPADGFVLGFHTAWDAQNPEALINDPATANFVQTFAWASWIEPGIFGAGFSDVTGLSHEIAEWAHDPFVDNATENWAFPDNSGACQNNLETGDPVEVLPSATVAITLNGYTYHPQTEAMLQWFTQEVPSSGYQGAYSFPNAATLPGPSTTCPPPPPPPATDAGAADGG